MKKTITMFVFALTAIGAQAQIVNSESHIVSRHVIEEKKTLPPRHNHWNDLQVEYYDISGYDVLGANGFGLTFKRGRAFKKDSPFFFEYGIGLQSLKGEQGGTYYRGSYLTDYGWNLGLVRVPMNLVYDIRLGSNAYLDIFIGLKLGVTLFGSSELYGNSSSTSSPFLSSLVESEEVNDWTDRFQVGYNAGIKMRIKRLVFEVGYSEDYSEDFTHYLHISELSFLNMSIGYSF